MASADAVEHAARQLGSRVADGDVVALCGVRRTVVEPAPRGAFAVTTSSTTGRLPTPSPTTPAGTSSSASPESSGRSPALTPATSTSSYRSASSCRTDDETCLPGRHGRHSPQRAVTSCTDACPRSRPGRPGRTERRTSAGTSGGTPKQSAGPKPGGQGSVSAHARSATGGRLHGWLSFGRPGGRGERLRRTPGEAAGEELGADPVNRSRGERGNRPTTARPAGQPGWWWAGPSSAVGRRAGRSPRSSPRAGKPPTGPRGTASSQ